MIFTNSYTYDLLFITAAFWLIIFLYFTRNFNHWKKSNVPFLPPIPFFGNAIEVFTLRKSIGDLCRHIYEQTTKPFIGIFICDEPYLLVRDVNLIKSVLVKDFAIWNDRTMTNNPKDDPMGSHILFLLKNPDWKELRRKITPVFTSGKMKLMYKLVKESGEDLSNYLEERISGDGNIVDIRDISAKYTTDAITSTSFGINANCFKDENSQFRQVSKRVFNWAILERAIATTCYFMAPTLVKLFKLRFVDTFSANFLRDVFWKTMHEREAKKFVRNDLLDILIEIKKHEEIDDPNKLDGDKLVAQATQFFLAGYETTSTTISFTLYELALHQDVQMRVREEILRVRDKYGGFTYEALQNMKFLDICIKETLRKYPVLPFLDRRCNQDYQIPGTDVVLKKGTGLFISTLGLHYDPQYFPNPHEYIPERFSEDNKDQFPVFSYLPFGEGPRNCIGNRFGMVSSKSGVAHILTKFSVEICKKTQNPMKFDPKGFLIAPIGGLYLTFKKI